MYTYDINIGSSYQNPNVRAHHILPFVVIVNVHFWVSVRFLTIVQLGKPPCRIDSVTNFEG